MTKGEKRYRRKGKSSSLRLIRCGSSQDFPTPNVSDISRTSENKGTWEKPSACLRAEESAQRGNKENREYERRHPRRGILPATWLGIPLVSHFRPSHVTLGRYQPAVLLIFFFKRKFILSWFDHCFVGRGKPYTRPQHGDL
ncbi:hypothetical protein BDV36DRAFT_41131 [Aspergillus pseudocaelatus]|uniref:Uncharacterized protein n=1 Tax=Aspergillus pseudocaelatus TaxID=1825620 RepID=A0ABQ6WWY7_9EURO|nr:hypothetical protein BDV36DRAFT_41131 [Aspergillus pseudocaelatus]